VTISVLQLASTQFFLLLLVRPLSSLPDILSSRSRHHTPAAQQLAFCTLASIAPRPSILPLCDPSLFDLNPYSRLRLISMMLSATPDSRWYLNPPFAQTLNHRSQPSSANMHLCKYFQVVNWLGPSINSDFGAHPSTVKRSRTYQQPTRNSWPSYLRRHSMRDPAVPIPTLGCNAKETVGLKRDPWAHAVRAVDHFWTMVLTRALRLR